MANKVIDAEVESYFLKVKPRKIGEIKDVVDFWRSYGEKQYPHLAKLAKRYLSIPAANSSSERVFSVLGRHGTSIRGSLDPKTLSHLVLMVSIEKYIQFVENQ